MKLKVNIGRMCGMKVYLHASFAIIPAYYLWDDLSWDGVMLCGIVVSTLLMHELAHAAVARLFGNRPIKMMFHGAGACVRLRRELGNTWRDALIVLAGPASNLLAGAVAWYCHEMVRARFGDGLECLRSFLCYGAIVNGMIGGLNLLPAYPLDGGRLFRWIASCLMKKRKAALTVLCAGIISAIAYVAWGCKLAFCNGGFIDLCIMLLVSVVVVGACWAEYVLSNE